MLCEFYIKKQRANTFAFGKSNDKVRSKLTFSAMTISPYSYAFALEHDYPEIRRWAMTGSFPSKLSGLHSILRANEFKIKLWVRYNEAHRRLVFRNSNVTEHPLFVQGYAEFCEFHDLVESALEEV